MSAAANFPNWVMLDRFVFCSEDEKSSPDESKAPIWSSGATSWCAPFRIAFKLDDAPKISRLYAQLPGFPDPSTALAIVATHHHLVLLRVAMRDRSGALLQDFFIYDAFNSGNLPSSLVRIPTCFLLDLDEHACLFYRCPPSGVEYRHVTNLASIGILSRGEGERDFAVAELNFVSPETPLVASNAKVHADLFFLRSSESLSDAGGLWKYARLVVRSSDGSYLTWPDFRWQTNTVIPASNCLCWIDYNRGMVSCNLFQELPLTLAFSAFPPDEFSLAEDPIIASCWFYCGTAAIDAGSALTIVRVIRHDGKRYGSLETGSSFTITCHTFQLDTSAIGVVWKRDYKRDYTVTSEELWSRNPPEILPRNILLFPQVNLERPHVVHFLLIHDFIPVMKKMSVVTIDLKTRIADSSPYINGMDDVGTEFAELMRRRSSSPQSFLSSNFSKFLQSSSMRPKASAAFRNFEQEARESAVWDSDQNATSSSGDNLASLYRPPLSLMFNGDFSMAKLVASSLDKWLLINLQSTKELSSHMLNRDTWGNEAVAQLIRSNFFFWQVYNDTCEGSMVCTFYHLVSMPAILLIDPATGQKMHAWNGMVHPDRLFKDLLPYLDKGPKQHRKKNLRKVDKGLKEHRRKHPRKVDQEASTGQQGKIAMEHEDEELAWAIAASLEESKEIIEASQDSDDTAETGRIAMEHEDEELAWAVAASLEESEEIIEASHDSDDMAETEPEVDDEPSLNIKPDYPLLPEEPTGSRDLLCRVAILLPNNRRIQRNFLQTDPIKLLWSFCAPQVEDGEKRAFHFVLAIPGASQKLEFGSDQTFKEAGLANWMIRFLWD